MIYPGIHSISWNRAKHKQRFRKLLKRAVGIETARRISTVGWSKPFNRNGCSIENIVFIGYNEAIKRFKFNNRSKITALRKNAKLTQEALGVKLGITGQAVSKWEKGNSMPDILILPNLCRELGCSLEDIAYYLRILTDEACLKVLFCTSADEAVTAKELMEKTGLDEAAVDRILLGLMKRNILCSAADNSGKRGYLQCAEAAGVYMILAGCCISGCGDSDKIDDFPGEWWFIRGID